MVSVHPNNDDTTDLQAAYFAATMTWLLYAADISFCFTPKGSSCQHSLNDFLEKHRLRFDSIKDVPRHVTGLRTRGII